MYVCISLVFVLLKKAKMLRWKVSRKHFFVDIQECLEKRNANVSRLYGIIETKICRRKTTKAKEVRNVNCECLKPD